MASGLDVREDELLSLEDVSRQFFDGLVELNRRERTF